MPDNKGWIVTTSSDRPMTEIANDLKEAGFSIGQVLEETGSITGHAGDEAAGKARSIAGVVDVCQMFRLTSGHPDRRTPGSQWLQRRSTVSPLVPEPAATMELQILPLVPTPCCRHRHRPPPGPACRRLRRPGAVRAVHRRDGGRIAGAFTDRVRAVRARGSTTGSAFVRIAARYSNDQPDPRLFYVLDDSACGFSGNAFAFTAIAGPERDAPVPIAPGLSFFDRVDQLDLFKLHLPYICPDQGRVDTLFLSPINRAPKFEVLSGLGNRWYAYPVNLVLRKPTQRGSVHVSKGGPVAELVFTNRAWRRAESASRGRSTRGSRANSRRRWTSRREQRQRRPRRV